MGWRILCTKLSLFFGSIMFSWAMARVFASSDHIVDFVDSLGSKNLSDCHFRPFVALLASVGSVIFLGHFLCSLSFFLYSVGPFLFYLI